MAGFMIRFLICNVLISGIIGILLTARRIFKNSLSSRMQYHLWFLLLGLLAVPFLPFRPVDILQVLPWPGSLRGTAGSRVKAVSGDAVSSIPSGSADWIHDFTLSVDSQIPSTVGYISLGIWAAGILVMILWIIKSALRLHSLKQSALPLQNPEIRRLYHRCLEEMRITKEIPIYSTAFLKSPMITGFLKPCIYLPIHLISDHHESGLRYMLLHELQHYRHKDALAGYLMNLAGVLYWFNPFVWFAWKEMRHDREIACDASVLEMLEEASYEEYGHTLINFAEKVSLTPFPFAAGLGGNMRQMERRILHIAAYQKPTLRKRIKGMAAFLLTAALLLGLAPALSTYGAETDRFQWDSSSRSISYIDLSAYFGGYEGSFVLYDLEQDVWSIHDMDHALLRTAPNSTYKLYDALFGLEEKIITPGDSLLAWDGTAYPFEAWNADQTLPSAMDASVNWYFQKIDEQLGHSLVQNYIQEIGYGNEDMSGGFPAYWMESSLKISPVEQIELLKKLHQNAFGYSPEHIDAVKASIRLSSSKDGVLYGKTGTGRVDGQDVNGWFIGYIETTGHTCFFAANIGASAGADGRKAAEMTRAILSDWNIWNE